MARDVMILMRAISISRAIGRGGPEIDTFLGPEMAMSKASAGGGEYVKKLQNNFEINSAILSTYCTPMVHEYS
jgi:hypothetical protein